ncbi:MAG: hypothetical protein NTX53_19900 [candidate division WOR-3 bacterium]|nr:hypothetical protein [candidate division WOR-3 bacterium]
MRRTSHGMSGVLLVMVGASCFAEAQVKEVPVRFVGALGFGAGYHFMYNPDLTRLTGIGGGEFTPHSGGLRLGAGIGAMVFDRLAPTLDFNWTMTWGGAWRDYYGSSNRYPVALTVLDLGLRMQLRQGSFYPYLLAGKTLKYDWVHAETGIGLTGGGEYAGLGFAWGGSGTNVGLGGFHFVVRPHRFTSLRQGGQSFAVSCSGLAFSVEAVTSWMLMFPQ